MSLSVLSIESWESDQAASDQLTTEEADRKFTSQKEQLLSDAHAKRVSKRQEEKKRLGAAMRWKQQPRVKMLQ